jgi:DHA1 family bicyclomycin/chloramphenicol resistance-like MFS transporter
MLLKQKESKLIAYILFFGSAILFATIDIYVPSLPDMQKFFKTSENMMQWTLAINLLGGAITGLFFGPLGDHFGRKKIIQINLVLYLIGTLVCIFSPKIELFMCGRLLQACGSSAQTVVGMAIIADLFRGVERARVLSTTGIIYPIAFASAPILGAELSVLYNWQASFIFLFIGASVYFILFSIYVPETLRSHGKRDLSPKSVFQDYGKFLKSKLFIFYSCTHALTITVFMLYLANASFIYKNHMNLDISTYKFFQIIPCVCQIVFTVVARHVLQKYGMRASFILGGYGYALSFVAMGAMIIFAPNDPYIVCAVTCIPYISSTFVFAVAVTKATELFPHMAGTTSAVFSFLRTVLSGILLAIGTTFLTSTIHQVYPYMMIIIAIIFFIILYILTVSLQKEDSYS